ncbi:MAG: hypothetical protein AAFP09_07500, partial [Cyanobacteria bacterium J06607_10]
FNYLYLICSGYAANEVALDCRVWLMYVRSHKCLVSFVQQVSFSKFRPASFVQQVSSSKFGGDPLTDVQLDMLPGISVLDISPNISFSTNTA